MFFHDDGELYVAPTGGGEAIVAALFSHERFRRDGIAHLLSSIPALCDRSARAEYTSPVLAAAPLGLSVPRVVDRDLLLIGDAAGASDPITADGISMALLSVGPAADAIVSGDLQAYQRTRLAAGRTAERLGRLLLRLTRKERLAALTPRTRRVLIPALLDVAIGRRSLTAAAAVMTSVWTWIQDTVPLGRHDHHAAGREA
jgi:flavin-dependent dehydrogenase